MENAKEIGKAFSLGYAFHAGFLFRCNHTIAKDAKGWITIKGTHVPVDDKGNLSGKVGKKIKTPKNKEKKETANFPKNGKNLINDSPTKDTNYYLKIANNKLSKAVTSYYDNELRGGFVNTQLEVDGENKNVTVVFDSKGRNEFKKFQRNLKQILEIMPYVPDVIKNGSYPGRRKVENHGPQKAFHTKMKRVTVNGKRKLVAIDIGETLEKNYHVYNVNTEGIPSFKEKKMYFEMRMKERAKKNKIGDASLLPSRMDSVPVLHGKRQEPRFVDKILELKNETVKMSILGIHIL